MGSAHPAVIEPPHRPVTPFRDPKDSLRRRRWRDGGAGASRAISPHPLLNDRIADVKATRDLARTDAERVEGALDRLGPAGHTGPLPKCSPRKRARRVGQRGDHLRALAQRIEVDVKEARIIGAKRASANARRRFNCKKAGFGVPKFVVCRLALGSFAPASCSLECIGQFQRNPL